jgi:hypothetical protein
LLHFKIIYLEELREIFVTGWADFRMKIAETACWDLVHSQVRHLVVKIAGKTVQG